MSTEQLNAVEIDIERARELIELAEALKRLHNNKDFKLIIREGYFKEEASRVVIVRADPEMASEEDQKQINDIITSIGGLFAYFHKIYALGNRAQMSLVADEETRSEILEEQLAEDDLNE